MNAFVNQKFSLLLVGVLGAFSFSFAQQKALRYTIISKNDSVGNMQAVQKISGDDIVYNIISNVETKLLMAIKVNVQEEVHYHKEKLIVSSSKRMVNDKPKGNKQTKAVTEGYLLTDDGKESKLNQKSIGYDFARLYFKEPISINQVYSNYYQKMLPIKTVGSHTYQIDLPEGGSNTYYYENGVCEKVDIRGALFNAQMILNQ